MCLYLPIDYNRTFNFPFAIVDLFCFNSVFFLFRTLTQQPMRVVMPAGTVQTSGTAQIIQTHLMPQAMLKQGKLTTSFSSISV